MKKTPGLNGNVYDFSVDYNVIDTSNINIVNPNNHTKCVILTNQKFINLHPNEYSQ